MTRQLKKNKSGGGEREKDSKGRLEYSWVKEKLSCRKRNSHVEREALVRERLRLSFLIVQ